MEYVLKLIRSMMSFSVFHWPHLRWRRWTRGKGPWKLPVFNPVTWISMTGPYAERPLASSEDERHFSHRPHCQGLIHVGNYSLSATGLESGCRGYNHFVSKVSPWCASPISALVKLGWNFFVPVPKYLSPRGPKPMASESPIWAHALENPESTYIERKVVILWMRGEAKNTQGEYGSYFKK